MNELIVNELIVNELIVNELIVNELRILFSFEFFEELVRMAVNGLYGVHIHLVGCVVIGQELVVAPYAEVFLAEHDELGNEDVLVHLVAGFEQGVAVYLRSVENAYELEVRGVVLPSKK